MLKPLYGLLIGFKAMFIEFERIGEEKMPEGDARNTIGCFVIFVCGMAILGFLGFATKDILFGIGYH